MKTYNTINVTKNCKIIDFEPPIDEVGEYVVDDSNFVPMSEAVRQLTTNALSDTVTKQYYDFADGKDTGIKVPITRTKNGKDIAEISTSIMEQVNDISNNIIDKQDKLNKKLAYETKLKNELNAISNNTPTQKE